VISQKAHSVLIVEDERIVAKDLQQTLQGLGYDAFAIASSAEEAIARATERRPDVVLMDIRIKGDLDGIAAADILRARFGVPVIYLTAHADVATIERAKETEPQGYLLKPVKSAELRTAIEVSRHRHELEKRLRASEQRYRRIIETTHEGVCTFDADLRCTFANRRMEEILGYGSGELMGKSIFDPVPEDKRALLQKNMERRRRGEPESGEIGAKRKDGTDVWLLFESNPAFEDGRFAGILTMVVDITERKRTEERLRRSEAQLRQAQEIAHIGSWEFDPTTNRVTRSVELCRILDLPEDEALVTTDANFDAVHPEDRERVTQEVAQAVRNGEPWTADYRIVRKDGVRFIHGRGEIVNDASGSPVRMMGTSQDVTEKKLAEARLVLSDRLASVGQMAAGVGHEINNPLAYVVSNLDMAAEEIRAIGGTSPPARLKDLEELISEARQGAERVRKIVRGLRTFSRIEEERLVTLDLKQVLELSINMAFNEIRHRARLVKDYGAVPAVEADEARLGQVFVNLLVNAAQAIPEGQADRNEIRVTTRTCAGGRAVVEVRDTGRGMHAEVLGRVFDPFFTTKAIGEGTGLGLSICHGIVTAMGGEIEVESEVGKGSLFRVTLPLADAVQAPEELANEPKAASAKRGHILIVDDEVSLAKVVGRAFAPEHDVTVLTSAKDALARLKSGDRFDVILCDLMMPEMTGMDLYAELSTWAPDLAPRMMFITGGAFGPSARSFLDQVPNQRFEKPFDIQNLRAAVRGFLR
jgi:PAS domain S-box-containing protein